MIEVIERLARRQSRYKREGFYFISESVDYCQKRIVRTESRNRHISGEELVHEVVSRALHEFGLLANDVFREWGITSTRDIGNIVFYLVDSGVLSTCDSDSRADFENVLDLERALECVHVDFELE